MIPSLQRFGSSWTEDKLERVRKYLVAYSTIMRKRDYPYAYIDGFAGTGYRELKIDPAGADLFFPEAEETEVAEFLDGSARIALQVEPRFHKYIFVEKDPKKAAELERLKADFPDKAGDIVVKEGDANESIRELCGSNWSKRRAVLFVDPFGMQLSWETLSAIGKTRAIDTWILFPIGSVNRLLVRDGQIPDGWRRRLDDLFGGGDWYEVFFPEKKSALFGDELVTRRKVADFKLIGEYFNRRLKTIFADVAPEPLTLRNSKGTPIFLLCFAAANPNAAATAIKIAQDILRREPVKPSMLPFVD